jgi:hypothetical protein
MRPCDGLTIVRTAARAFARLPATTFAGGNLLPVSFSEPGSMVVVFGPPSDITGSAAPPVFPHNRVFRGELVAALTVGVTGRR